MEYIVTETDDGRFLREVLRGPMALSYTAMKSAKWSDRIRVNGGLAHRKEHVIVTAVQQIEDLR